MAKEKYDVFVSYAREDRERVRPLVQIMEDKGWKVWWDLKIPAGKKWDEFILEKLGASAVMVVVWSVHSIKKDMVKEEAIKGKSAGKLIPVRIDNVEPPFGFSLIQATDLTGWEPGTPHKELEDVLKTIQQVLTEAAVPGEEKPHKAIDTLKAGKAWQNALQKNTILGFISFLEQFPESAFAPLALKKIKELGEKQEKMNPEVKLSSPQLMFPQKETAPLTSWKSQYSYWENRLSQINRPSGQPITSFPTQPVPENDFVFYRSPLWYGCLILFPILGILGAWLTDFLVGLVSDYLGDEGSFESVISPWWLYLAGIIWGLVYLIAGTAEALEPGDLFYALAVPYDELSDGNLAGLFCALPFNLLIAWGTAFLVSLFLVNPLVVLIAFGILTLIQMITYPNLM